MCSQSLVSCPLCCQSNFPSIESLKINLIKVNSKPLQCPLCNETVLGLDKLTIHLFGHTLPDDEFNRKMCAEDEHKSVQLNQVKQINQVQNINKINQVKNEKIQNVAKKNNR